MDEVRPIGLNRFNTAEKNDNNDELDRNSENRDGIVSDSSKMKGVPQVKIERKEEGRKDEHINNIHKNDSNVRQRRNSNERRRGSLDLLEISHSSSFLSSRSQDIERWLADRDSYYKELRGLAIRIQKNGGVHINDKKWGGRTIKHCFSTSDLIVWLQDTFDIEKQLAWMIGFEMWQHGLIAHVANMNLVFDEGKTIYFRVAHPYAINLLQPPSRLESLYSKLRGIQGPKLTDRLVGGRSYKSSISGIHLVDWLVSVYKCSREGGVHIAQQLINEGYLYGVARQGQSFRDDEGLYQYKHDYTGDLDLSTSRLEQITRVLERFHKANGVPATVGSCIEHLEKVIDCCATTQAAFIFDKLVTKRKVRVQMKKGLLGKGSTVANLLKQKRNDSQRRKRNNTAQPRRASFSWLRNSAKGTAVYPLFGGSDVERRKSTDEKDRSSRRKRHERENQVEQFELDAIVSFVNGISSSNSRSLFHQATKSILETSTTSKLKDVLPQSESYFANSVHDEDQEKVQALLECGDGKSILKLHRRKSAKTRQQENLALMAELGGSGFAVLTRAHQLLKLFSRIVQVGLTALLWFNLFAMTKSTLPIKEGIEQNIHGGQRFGRITEASEMLDWIETEQLESNLSWTGNQLVLLTAPRILLGKTVPGQCLAHLKTCRFNRQKGVLHELGLFADETYPLFWNSGSGFDSEKNLEMLEDLRNMSHVDTELMIFDLLVLENHASPPNLIHVRTLARMGPLNNQILVRAVHVPLENELTYLQKLILFASVLLLLGYLLRLFLLGFSYFCNMIGAFVLVRATTAIAAVALLAEYNSRVFQFLTAEEGEDHRIDYHGEVVQFQNLATWSRICFVISMFLGTLAIAGNILGDQFNIFAILHTTVSTVLHDALVLLIGFVSSFTGFAISVFALMNSHASEFSLPGTAAISMVGSLFGGTPWAKFRAAKDSDPVLTSVGFILMASYLLFIIFVLVSMMTAIIIGSYQVQKKKEASLNDELKRHLHASGDRTGISTLLRVLSERLERSGSHKSDLVKPQESALRQYSKKMNLSSSPSSQSLGSVSSASSFHSKKAEMYEMEQAIREEDEDGSCVEEN